MTLYLTELRDYDWRTIKKTSLRCKQALAAYLVGLWIYCIAMIIVVSTTVEDWEGKSDKYVNIV